MEWAENTVEGVTIINLKGEIDLQFSPALRTLLQTQLKKHVPILVMDFSEVGYIDSSGLATLVEYYQQSRSYGGRIALAALNPRVRSIFDLVRLNEIFPIFDTVAVARTELLRAGTAGPSPG
jgi:anti-sigma B factor antagonist